jgi:hypothetical protein
MKKIVSGLVFLIILFSIYNCNDALLENLEKPNRNPFNDAPIVYSFETSSSLRILWREDAAADEYLLYRDTSLLGDFTTCVYSGNATGITDQNLNENRWYYYKLKKRRGERIFESEVYGYGYASTVVDDLNEDNDCIEHATEFTNVSHIQANIYCFRDALDNMIEDVDWYKVQIPGGFYLVFMLTEYTNMDPNGGDLCYYQIGQANPQPVNEGQLLSIYNYSTKAQYFYFLISPSEQFAGVGEGKVGSYRVSFVSIHMIVPAG